MAAGTGDELEKQCGSMYKLVIMAAKRAKEIAEGATPLVRLDGAKVASVALEEIRQGKVFYKAPPVKEAKGAKKSKARGAKAKKKSEGS